MLEPYIIVLDGMNGGKLIKRSSCLEEDRPISASEVHELNAGDTYQSRAGISK